MGGLAGWVQGGDGQGLPQRTCRAQPRAACCRRSCHTPMHAHQAHAPEPASDMRPGTAVRSSPSLRRTSCSTRSALSRAAPSASSHSSAGPLFRLLYFGGGGAFERAAFVCQSFGVDARRFATQTHTQLLSLGRRAGGDGGKPVLAVVAVGRLERVLLALHLFFVKKVEQGRACVRVCVWQQQAWRAKVKSSTKQQQRLYSRRGASCRAPRQSAARRRRATRRTTGTPTPCSAAQTACAASGSFMGRKVGVSL